MHDLDSAIDDIVRIREHLAASTRFRGFAPGVVALTGLLALGLAAWQAAAGTDSLPVWIVLAAVCALMIGTEAIIRARILHRSMADRLLNTTLNRFMPAAVAGAILGFVVLSLVPEHARLLPGLWQLLMGIGIFAALGNLPRPMAWVAVYYFATASVSLALSGMPEIPAAWLMGLPFGIGQLLVAIILHLASKEVPHD